MPVDSVSAQVPGVILSRMNLISACLNLRTSAFDWHLSMEMIKYRCLQALLKLYSYEVQ